MGFFLTPRKIHKRADYWMNVLLYEVAIRASGGNVTAVARAMGVSFTAAQNRIRNLGLAPLLRSVRKLGK